MDYDISRNDTGAKMTQLVRATQKDFGKERVGIKAPYFDGTQPCAETDPEIFFPDTTREATRIKGTVRKICGSCEFQEPCLEYSLVNDVRGVWGGMLDSERKNIRRSRRLA